MTRQEKFEEFHQQHPEVYQELLRLAREAQCNGFSKFGIRTIWETMRWNFAMKSATRDAFKLNDHLTSSYARVLMAQEIDLVGFFETRQKKANRSVPEGL
jgi:hypothetical protein